MNIKLINFVQTFCLKQAAGVKQPIDKRVNEKMLQLIGNGMKSIQLIEQSIKEFVKDELFRDSPCPPHSNRRFFPTQKDIANRIFKVSVSSLSSKLKIDKLEDLVYGLLEEQQAQNGFIFFRSSVGTDDSTLDCSDKHNRVAHPIRDQTQKTITKLKPIPPKTGDLTHRQKAYSLCIRPILKDNSWPVMVQT